MKSISETKEVLSVPAASTIELINKYLIHACPNRYRYKQTQYITFRHKDGIMSALFDLKKTIILTFNPHETNWEKNINNKDPLISTLLLQYINERNKRFHFKNEDYRFYYFVDTEKIELNHTPRLKKNIQGHTYLTLKELISGISEISVSLSIKDNIKEGNLLDDYSSSRIIRRCGQLGLAFDDVINSTYFSSPKRTPPKSIIQYSDGESGFIGWGDDKRPISENDVVPFSKSEMIDMLGLSADQKTRYSGYWTFFCNPVKWEIDKFLASNITYDTYQVAKWQKDHFFPGQLGVIRVGVDRRTKKQLEGRNKLESGIYAIVEVLSTTLYRENKPDKFWRKWTDDELLKPIVKIKYLKNLLDNPKKLSSIIGDPVIRQDQFLIDGFQASSMPLKKIVFERLLQLAGLDDDLFENIDNTDADSVLGIIQAEKKLINSTPQVKEVVSKRIERGKISNLIKKVYNYKCMVCECLGNNPYSFKKTDGNHYVEAHHITPVSRLKIGSLGMSNLITVCANHHRQFHYGNIQVIDNNKELLRIIIDGEEIEIQKKALAYLI